MTLTTAQLTIWKADIAGNAATINGVQIKDMSLLSGDRRTDIANWYNGIASPDFFGNYRNVPVEDIFNAVAWKNFTPTDVVPTDTALNASIHSARTNAASQFLFVVQTMLGGRATIDATKASTVSGLKDATNTDMPMGASGAAVKGGWGGASGIQSVLCRKGNRLEQLLATKGAGGSNTDGSTNLKAATFTFEGQATEQDLVG